jgi:hypothetical protein
VPPRKSPPALRSAHGYPKVEIQKPGIEEQGAIEKRHRFTRLKLVNLSRDTAPGDCLVHPQYWEPDALSRQNEPGSSGLGVTGSCMRLVCQKEMLPKSPMDLSMKEN